MNPKIPLHELIELLRRAAEDHNWSGTCKINQEICDRLGRLYYAAPFKLRSEVGLTEPWDWVPNSQAWDELRVAA